MSAPASPTPEGRRCPECGSQHTICASDTGRYVCQLCGEIFVPTPAPEGGVPETRLCNQPAGDEELCQLPAGHEGRCAHPDYPPGWRSDNEHDDPATPTSAEGGEAGIVDWTAWRKHLIVCAACTAHHVCAEGSIILGSASPEDAPWLASLASATTGEEEETPEETALRLVNDGAGNNGARLFASECEALVTLLSSLRRQLAEAEEEIAALKSASTGGYWWSQAVVARERATTAERRLEGMRADYARSLQLSNDLLTASQQEVARLRTDVSIYRRRATGAEQQSARLREALENPLVRFALRYVSDARLFDVEEAMREYGPGIRPECDGNQLRHDAAALLAALSTPRQGKEQGA